MKESVVRYFESRMLERIGCEKGMVRKKLSVSFVIEGWNLCFCLVERSDSSLECCSCVRWRVVSELCSVVTCVVLRVRNKFMVLLL